MSQGILETPADLNDPIDPNDRFAYGWRYVRELLPDGTESTKQIPLTLEDILHPQEEDFRLLSDPHWQDCFYLGGAFKAALASVPGAHVIGDCRVAWDEEGKYAHGPDIAVIFNVRKYHRWSTFNVIHEGTRPSLIVEVTSPETRSTDLVNKKQEYAEEGVLHYIIADARERVGTRRIWLIDYRLDRSSDVYEEKELDENGRIWLDEVNLWLGVESGRLACYDRTGKRIGDYVEVTQALAESEKKAAEETRARTKAEKQLKKLAKSAKEWEARSLAMEEELRRLRGEKNEGK